SDVCSSDLAFDFPFQRREIPLFHPGRGAEFPAPQPGSLITRLPGKGPSPADVYPERVDTRADECPLARDIPVFLELDMEVGCHPDVVIVGVGLISDSVPLPHTPADCDRQISRKMPVDHLDAQGFTGHDHRSPEIAVCMRSRYHFADRKSTRLNSSHVSIS